MIYSSKLLIDDVMNLLAEPYVIIDIDNGIGENLNGDIVLYGLIQFENTRGVIPEYHREPCQYIFGCGQA